MQIQERTFVAPNLAIREQMEQFRVNVGLLPQSEVETNFCHTAGMLAKTIHLKKGQVLVGKIHLLEHINIMSSGDITVLTEEGERRLTGFNIIACKPGSRRAALVHEDTIWTTILPTSETDPAKIEEMFFAKNHAELEN